MTISANYPSVIPSLSLDFANSGVLDNRITFSRPTTASYYDANTTALAEQNLFLYSQTFGNAAWVSTNNTITTGITDPASGTTAQTLTASASNSTFYQTVTLTATANTVSFYIQRVTGTGTINFTLDGTNFTAISAPTGSWVRYSITATPTAGAKTVGIQIVTSGDAINIAFGQLENRSSATAYNATTTTAITNYIPVLLTAPTNQARFDHDPVARTSLGLLIEQQSTNLFTYSSAITAGNGWSLLNTTANNTATIAPDGTQTANQIIESTSTSTHGYAKGATVVSGTSYTTSIYIKPISGGSARNIALYDVNGVGSVIINPSTLTVVTGASFVVNMTSVGNGWIRASYTTTATGTSGSMFAYMANGTTISYTGDGYSGVYIWGAQLEAGAFATSYIPTVASQVTRSADSASITGTNFSSWYNISQGTFYISNDSYSFSNNPFLLSVNDGGNTNLISIAIYGGKSEFYIVKNNIQQADLLTANVASQNIMAKTGVSYSTNNFANVLNGSTVVTNSSGSLPTVNKLTIGSSATGTQYNNGHISKISYYPLQVTNANLIALTGS